jgi:hypothetical protein
MRHKKIIIAGGTGFIGQGLIKYFGKDNEIIVLNRQSGDVHKNLYSEKLISGKDGFNVRYVKWNGETIEETWANEIDGADLVINLEANLLIAGITEGKNNKYLTAGQLRQRQSEKLSGKPLTLPKFGSMRHRQLYTKTHLIDQTMRLTVSSATGRKIICLII